MTEHPAAPATEADHLRWLVRNSERVYPEAVESALSEARTAARKEVRDEIDREMPDEWTPWESDKADEAFGYNDALRRVRIILDSLSTDTREEPTDD